MILTFLFLLLTLILSLIYFIRIPSYRTYKLAQKIQGPNKFSILGITFDLAQLDATTILTYFLKCAEKYPKIGRYWLLGVPMVALYEPEYIKEVLGSDRHLKKGWEYDYFKTWMGNGMFTTYGDDWKKRKAIFSIPLNYKLNDKIGYINNHANDLVENLLKKNETNVNVLEHIAICSLHISCEAILGVKMDEKSEEGKKYVSSLKYILDCVCYRVLNGIYMKDWMFKLTPLGKFFDHYLNINYDYTRKVIRERVELKGEKSINYNESVDRDLGIKEKKPFVDTLLEGDSILYNSENKMITEISALLFAAHDTTAVTLTYVIFCLANNKEIQKKVFEEQESIFGTSKRDATPQDLKQMTYLSQVLKESMRLYPTIPYLSRELEEDVLCDDTLVPKGSNVLILPLAVHRNPKIYPEPEKFDPERFSPDECRKRHPYAYLPFSAGPRNCQGQKYAELTLKVVLSTVIRNFEIEAVTKPEELVFKLAIVLLTEKPILAKFIPRN